MVRSRTVNAVLCACAVAVLAAGCTRAGSSAAPTTTAVAADRGELPPEDRPDPARFDFGNKVSIEEDRVVPLRLGATIDRDVEFVNASDREILIRFHASLDSTDQLTSGPIPPGEAFTVRPRYLGQFTYTVEPEPIRTGGIEVHTVEGLKNEPGK